MSPRRSHRGVPWKRSQAATSMSSDGRVSASDRIRIGLVAPPWFPVPPLGYGGIEAVVAMLADEVVARGHAVTLDAAGEAETNARLPSRFPEAPSDRIGSTVADLEHALVVLE